MMIKATDIRRGMVITMEGVNFVVLDFAHHTPGNLRAMVQTKLRNMNSGSLIDKRLRSVDQIEVPYVETKEYEYLYSSGDEHVFMDTETYDQLSFSHEIIGTAMDYLLPNSKVMVKYINDKPVSIEIPDFVELTVTDTPPALAGATATNQYKEATLETGLKVDVPPFVRPGREDPDRHPDRRVSRAGEVTGRVSGRGERSPTARCGRGERSAAGAGEEKTGLPRNPAPAARRSRALPAANEVSAPRAPRPDPGAARWMT